MSNNRYKEPLFIWHIVGLVITFLLTFLLTFTFMFQEWSAFRPMALIVFAVEYSASNLVAGLALKRIGHSPWLALSGFVMGLIPLILYLALPDKSPKST